MNIDTSSIKQLWLTILICVTALYLFKVIILVILYGIQYSLSNKEKSNLLKEFKNFYNKEHLLIYTLENKIDNNFISDKIHNKFTDFKINGLTEFNQKIIRYWDKQTTIKVVYTLFEGGKAETNIFYKIQDGREWILIDCPYNLMEYYVPDSFKSWQISFKDKWRLKNSIKSALITYGALVSISVLSVIMMNASDIWFNIVSFVKINILYVTTVVLIIISILLLIIAIQLHKNRRFF